VNGSAMKIRQRETGQILQPCSLEWFAYQIDPYIGCEHHCHYCYTLNQTDTDATKEIIIHRDLAGQLKRDLSALEPQTVYMGMNTDPYQPCERAYEQTRQVLKLLAERAFAVCVLTKSDLTVRDIDLFAKMKGSSVGISIAFQDERVRQLFEAKAPPNEKRTRALKNLKQAGIETYALLNPVMPFITDVGQLIEMVAPYADTIWIYGLSMEKERDRNWQNVKRILNRHFPDLTEKYRQIAFSKDHPYWAELRRELERLQREKGLNLRIEL
jgi:DNA repair photolyase